MKEVDKKNNFLHLEKDFSSYKNSKIVLFPIEFSSETFAAKEIIKASSKLEVYDEEQGKELALQKGICTLAGLNLSKDSYKKASEKISNCVTELLNDNKFVASISGNHASTFGIIKSYSEKYKKLTILHLDAKANLKLFSVSKNPHDSLMRSISEVNSNIVQVGIRSISKSENDYRKEKGIKQFLASEIKLGMYGNDWQEIVEKNVTDDVYITIDLSVFDPSIFPNVEDAEPGGLQWDDILYLLKIIGQGRNVVGIDICGLKPNKNFASSNYFTAKLLYKILNYAL